MYNGFTIDEVSELVKADIMSLREYSDFFSMPFSTVAWLRRQCGIKKMELEKWTPLQVEWLRRLYTWMGDYEIALLFDEAYPKKKGWTLKHIEKKRNYLGLHRSKEQLHAIKQRNKKFGCWMVGSIHTWETRGRAEEGTVKQWGKYKYVKEYRGYERLILHTWLKHNKVVPEGKIIVRKNTAGPEDDINNLEAITREELAKRNSFHRYPIELKRTIIQLNKLKKEVYAEHQ